MSNLENFLIDHASVVLIIIGIPSIITGWYTNQNGVIFGGIICLILGMFLIIFLFHNH